LYVVGSFYSYHSYNQGWWKDHHAWWSY